jgi:hypothetical protein
VKHPGCLGSAYRGCCHSSVPPLSARWDYYALFSETGSSVREQDRRI